MAVKFLSNEWYELLKEGLKKEFTVTGGVSLAFTQVVENAPTDDEPWIRYELDNSIFKDLTMGTGDYPECPFVAFADYGTYKRVVEGDLDGSEGLLTGEFTLVGNMAKAMALLGTYNRIEAVQRSIQTEF